MSVTTNSKTPMNLLLRPRDPIILRDARPFSADPGARAFTLDWPLPGTLTGALRTHIGNAANINWHDQDDHARARGIRVKGPFPVDRQDSESKWTPYFPAPRDAVIHTPEGKKRKLMCLRPEEPPDGAGCNLPAGPSGDLAPLEVDADEKPDHGFDYWSLADTIHWLSTDQRDQWRPKRWCGHPPRETRIHVKVDPDTLAAAEGFLFATEALVFSPDASERQAETAMLCGVTVADDLGWEPARAFLPLGGERRRVVLDPDVKPTIDPWTIPKRLLEALVGKQRLRLQLVTPAIFRTGWCPGWLTQRHRDRNPPEINGLGLKLRAAAVGRRIPISGWDFTNKCEKPVRYAAPAGSVYFFTVAKPLTEEQVHDLWLAPLSDRDFNRQDGFGLVVPGVWNTSSAES